MVCLCGHKCEPGEVGEIYPTSPRAENFLWPIHPQVKSPRENQTEVGLTPIPKQLPPLPSILSRDSLGDLPAPICAPRAPCLPVLFVDTSHLLPPPPHPTQLHLAGGWGESCPSILFICTERGLNKCLVSDRRMTTKGTIRGKLNRKGPLRSPGPLSYPMPSALCWTPLGIGSLCHPRQLSPLPVGRKWLPWVNQRRDSGGGTSQVNFKAVVSAQWAVEKLERVKMK